MNIRLLKIIIWLFVFYILLMLPILSLSHSNIWYEYNIQTDNTSILVEESVIENATNNLISYFYYKENLDRTLWSKKEVTHYKDVRSLFLIGTILLILLLIIVIINSKILTHNIKTFFILNIITIIILSSFIGIFFDLFWNKIFHNILFSNDLWIMGIDDLSYYIFKEDFFKRTSLAIGILFIIENIILSGIIHLYNKKSLYKKQELNS